MSEHDGSIPLRDYVEMRFAAQDKVTELAMKNGEAYIAQFHELRSRVDGERGMFVPREAFDMAIDEGQRRAEDLQTRLTVLEERLRTTVRNMGAALTLLGLAFTVINFVRGNPF